MGMLQVKNLPEDLHAALADRARREGVSMSEYVTRLLRRDLSRPTMTEWLAEQRDASPTTRRIDVVHALDIARLEYDPDERYLAGATEDDAAPR
jgi:antitoxin FitA